MASLGLGLIGLGRHGLRYARHLLDGIPNGDLVAICRRDTSKGQAFATEHGLRFYQDPNDLIADSNVQAILIVTPPAEAIPIALKAVHHNKPVLIEKPMGCTAMEAKQLLDASTQAQTPVMVGHTLRYEEAIQQLKTHGDKIGKWQYLVLTNRLVSPIDSGAHRTSPHQGTLLEIGIHQLDLIWFLTQQNVVQVYCEMARLHPHGPDIRAWASLQTETGLSCLLDVSRQSKTRVTRAEIVGETGQLIADWSSNSLLQLNEDGSSTLIPLTPKPTIPQVISDFIQAIKQGTPMPISGHDGLRAVEIADACYESATKGNPVSLKRH